MGYLYPVKRRATTVMSVLSTPVHPLKCVTSRIVHRASVIQTVKQTIPLFRKRYTEDVTTVQQSTHVTCYRLINVYRTHHQPSAASGGSQSTE
jgi:hypothetical protein